MLIFLLVFSRQAEFLNFATQHSVQLYEPFEWLYLYLLLFAFIFWLLNPCLAEWVNNVTQFSCLRTFRLLIIRCITIITSLYTGRTARISLEAIGGGGGHFAASDGVFAVQGLKFFAPHPIEVCNRGQPIDSMKGYNRLSCNRFPQ